MDGSTITELKEYTMSRDCEVDCVLDPGSYIVVPRTTGCNIGPVLEDQFKSKV